MNIAFVSRHDKYVKGGIQTVSKILSKKFTDDGHKVFWLSLIKSEITPLYEVNAFLSEGYINYYFPESDCESENNRHFLDEFIRKNKIDVLINQYGAYHAESKLFLSSQGCKKISVIHINPRLIGDNYFHYLWTGGWKRRIRIPLLPFLKYRFNRSRKEFYTWLLQASDSVSLLSNSFKSSYSCLEEASNVIGIYNPMNNYDGININPSDKKKQIVFVGRLDMIQKAPDEILYVFKEVEKKHSDWNLVIIGDGDDRRYLESLSRKLGLKNIKFTGFIDPICYYEESAILLQTSNNEGFPMVLIESLANKCVPVIYDSFAAAKDMIDDSVNGYLIKPKDRKAMAEKVNRLIEEADLREEMAESAYKKSLTFSVENIARQWYDLFDQLLKE